MSGSESGSPVEPEGVSRGGLGRIVEAGMQGEAVSLRGVLAAIGGWRGIAETVIPVTVYLVCFVVTRDARLSAIAPLVLAIGAFVWRLARKQPVQGALSGLVGVGVCVAVTLFTGRGETYFLPGFWINGAWLAAHFLSLVVGWPLIGLLLGFLRGSLTDWRRVPVLKRAAVWCTFLWMALFASRLAVQLPLYFAAEQGDAGATDALGLARLLMGVPLFALVVLLTWLILGRLSTAVDSAQKDAAAREANDGPTSSSDDSAGEIGSTTGESAP